MYKYILEDIKCVFYHLECISAHLSVVKAYLSDWSAKVHIRVLERAGLSTCVC